MAEAEQSGFLGSPGGSINSSRSPSKIHSTDGPALLLAGRAMVLPRLMSTCYNIAAPTSTDDNLNHNQPMNHPAPKTDKPRPHVCGTCGRSFARLEHLKRHERSHTKEKPFECPECTRCFARRDLLLRHQQKLHMTTTAPKKPSRRRESVSGVGVNPSGKVRKNSIASGAIGRAGGAVPTIMRPRANTISHVDGTTLNMMAATNSTGSTVDLATGHSHAHNLARSLGGFGYRGMAAANGIHWLPHGPPRLTINGFTSGFGEALRTAPIGPTNSGFDFDQYFGPGSTINPAQLHLDEHGGMAGMQYDTQFSQFVTGSATMEDDSRSEYIRWYNSHMSLDGTNPNEQAIGESSPSIISTGSPGGNAEIMFDGPADIVPLSDSLWASGLMPPRATDASPFPMDDAGSIFPDFGPPPVLGQNDLMEGLCPAFLSTNGQSGFDGLPRYCQHPMAFSPDGTSVSSASLNGSSATSVSTDSITDITRQALLVSLAQPPVLGQAHRNFSQPTISSQLSPRDTYRATGTGCSLPNTQDLQRYVNAYIYYFHPHFPFLHIPTLTFDAPAYNTNVHAANGNSDSGHGGGGCLILAMAAIGALYEFDRSASKELFDGSKRLIQLYLEERRTADMYAAANSRNSGDDGAAQKTPLWLVQAMLLNVIYGHNCGDKTSGEIASTHCAALVSLAKAAELLSPMSLDTAAAENYMAASGCSGIDNIHMGDDMDSQDPWASSPHNRPEHAHWLHWIVIEERKRTLFAIFHMSSLLVSAYNHAPALMNSEIQLDLPCEEGLWCAQTALLWAEKGGAHGAQQRAIPFSAALSHLLTASQNEQDHQATWYKQPFGSSIPRAELPQSDLQPSTFGCLVLINALHNYIWETRQRHSGRQWTTQETESMHAHVEPALRAWQAAWASNPAHSLERPNPFGLGPLSADSIPLLDLAYVRLFVNLGTSKEAFWKRDFDEMAEELARGSEIVQHAEYSDNSTNATNTADASRNSPVPRSILADMKAAVGANEDDATLHIGGRPQLQQGQSKRERHLRKAAFYAADSLTMSDKLGVTFADFSSRELPVQSALCTFDCAQVLAEWVATVQERVGRYLGILGRDDIDYATVPAIMLLEEEDEKLLEKISDILKSADAKMAYEIGAMPVSAAVAAIGNLPSATNGGYGSKILMVTAYMLERAAVWPVTSIMARGLAIQAVHMTERAKASIIA